MNRARNFGLILVFIITIICIRRIIVAYNDIIIIQQESEKEAISAMEYLEQVDTLLQNHDIKGIVPLAEKRVQYALKILRRHGSYVNSFIDQFLIIGFEQSAVDEFRNTLNLYLDILSNKYAYLLMTFGFDDDFLSYITSSNGAERKQLNMAKELQEKYLKEPDFNETLDKIKTLDVNLYGPWLLMKDVIFCWMEIIANVALCLAVWTKCKGLVNLAWLSQKIFYFLSYYARLPIRFLVLAIVIFIQSGEGLLYQLYLLNFDVWYLQGWSFDLYSARMVRTASMFYDSEECGDLNYVWTYYDPCFNLKVLYMLETMIFCYCLAEIEENPLINDLFPMHLVWDVIAQFLSFAIDKISCKVKRMTKSVKKIFFENFWIRTSMGQNWKKSRRAQKWFDAANRGDIGVIKEMLDKGKIDVNLKRPTDGETCLTIGCRKGRLDMVQALLAYRDGGKKCDVNIATTKGDTALSICASNGYANVVTRLLQCNEIVLCQGKAEKSIHQAIQGEFYNVAQMIYKKLLASNIEVTNSNFKYLPKAVMLNRALQSKRLSEQVKKQKRKMLDEYKTLLLQPENQRSQLVQQDTDSSALHDLLALADCYICFDSMLDKRIFACSHDHWVCEECLPENKCPMCQEDLRENPPRRCCTVEKAVALMYQVANLNVSE